MNYSKLSNYSHPLWSAALVFFMYGILFLMTSFLYAVLTATYLGWFLYSAIGKGTEFDVFAEDLIVNKNGSWKLAIEKFDWDETVKDIGRNAIGAVLAFAVIIAIHLM
jgi:hypothetical protein